MTREIWKPLGLSFVVASSLLQLVTFSGGLRHFMGQASSKTVYASFVDQISAQDTIGRNDSLDDHMVAETTAERNESFMHVTTSPYSNRKFLAFVVSTMGADHRLDHFKKTWKATWPDLHIYTQYSFRNAPQVRGYACYAGDVLGMHLALKHAREHEEFDYLIIFEDDALPFPNTTWPQKEEFANELDLRLDALERSNGSSLFIDAHGIRSYDTEALQKGETMPGNITRIHFNYGTYAWIASRHILPDLHKFYEDTLAKKTNWKLAPDNQNYDFFSSYNLTAYVTNPLMVDHAPIDGKSQTWAGRGGGPKRDWEGVPEWWTQQDNQKAPW